MAFHVQAEIRKQNTIYIGWFECGEILQGKREEGYSLYALWPNTILEDRKGVDGADLRSISDKPEAKAFGIKLKALEVGF